MEENLDEILEESNDKNKFSKDKKSIAIIILTALLIIILICSSQMNAETFTKLSSVLTSKDEIIQENQKQIEDLKDEKNTLIQENQNLESEKHQLQCAVDVIKLYYADKKLSANFLPKFTIGLLVINNNSI